MQDDTRPAAREKTLGTRSYKERSEATRQRILAAARSQFVANGLEGTRMEAIATEAGVNKSLVYRHFGSREQLYRDVLSKAYRDVREAEARLVLPTDPLAALDTLVSFTLGYYLANPDFLVLVGIENLKKGEHLRQIGRDGVQVSSLIGILNRIISSGTRDGLFRDDLDAMELYMIMASQCWFTVATMHTFGITFDVDMFASAGLRRREAIIKDSVRRYVLRDPSAAVLV
jgi:AcrR family transcriptional regulator